MFRQDSGISQLKTSDRGGHEAEDAAKWACYLVYLCGALCEDGADGGGKAQLHQALQVSLGIRLHLVSGLLQRAAVYQGETPARAQRQVWGTVVHLSATEMSTALPPKKKAMQAAALWTEKGKHGAAYINTTQSDSVTC